MYSGKCLCGVIKVKVGGPISDIIHCHCSLCRKSSGSAYATNGFIDFDKFKIISGEEILSTYVFKPGRNRHFCSCCGSPIYSSNEQDPRRVRIRLGILDTDIKERPISHNFVTSRAIWEDLDVKLPRYEAYEPNRE